MLSPGPGGGVKTSPIGPLGLYGFLYSLFISRCSHERASFQSRITLCPEIFNTSAVSSTLRRQKKQFDHPRLARIDLRQSGQGVGERDQPLVFGRTKLRRTSRLIPAAPAPRLAERRARAASTSILRMV